MPCDPERYQHVVLNVIPGSGALTFNMQPKVDEIRERNPSSVAITCQCGTVQIGMYAYWRDKHAIEEAQRLRSAHRRITL